MEYKMETVFSAVTQKDTQALLAMFHNGEVKLELPSYGVISSNRIFKMLLDKIAFRFSQLNLSAKYIATHCHGDVLVAEYRLEYLFYDEERNKDVLYAIPTALVCDLDEEGKFTRVVVYTGMEYLVGKQILRPALYNGDAALWEALPASVAACYEKEKEATLTEPCRVHTMEGCVCVEETVLKTRSVICTPQARLSVFALGQDGAVEERRNYGEVVWDFKLWPVLY